jgi:hypothetical protein
VLSVGISDAPSEVVMFSFLLSFSFARRLLARVLKVAGNAAINPWRHVDFPPAGITGGGGGPDNSGERVWFVAVKGERLNTG